MKMTMDSDHVKGLVEEKFHTKKKANVKEFGAEMAQLKERLSMLMKLL